MKKVILFAAAIVSMLCLAACTAVQVNERMFVSLMGIEEDEGLYYLTIQAYSSTDANSDAPVPEYRVYSGTGRSFYEAADMIMRQSGRELFFGHCTCVFADDDIIRDKEKLKMLAGERISPGCPVIYSEDPGAEADRKDENDELTGSDIIISGIERYAAEGLYSEVTLRDVISADSAGGVVILPLSEKGISGSAAVNTSGETVLLDLSETAALNLLRGEKGVRMSVLGGSLSTRINDKSVYFRQWDNVGEYNISIKAEGVLTELGKSESLEDYKKEAEKIISGSAEAICEKAFKDGFLPALFPREYSFSEGYDNVNFSVDTELTLTALKR
ncbi:MAG: hypothetical protein PUI48_02755 [Oscillospiraceae bacterium]|nr:hypothetical protein [Oscillospiraceae bacterium]MDY6209378.1 hypothetical protein [Oscillospiraceae bacterium]